MHGRAVVGDPGPVVDAHDRLGAVHPVVVVFDHPRAFEVRVDFLQVRHEKVHEFVARHLVQLVIPAGVVADVEDVLAAVEFFVDQVGVLDQGDERHVGVRDVHPIFVGERPVHHHYHQDRRQVVNVLQLALVFRWHRRCQPSEHVGRGGSDDGVIFPTLGFAALQLHFHGGGRRLGHHDLRHRSRGMDDATLLRDPVSQDFDHLAEAAHGIAEMLNLPGPFSGRHAQGHLVPDPGHADLVVELAELPPEQRLPDDFIAPSAHSLGKPVSRRDAFELAVGLGFLQYERPESDPDPV